MTAASIAVKSEKVAFTSAMVLLANISRMLKQLPLTARTWGHFKLPKINHNDDNKNALEKILRTSTVSSTFRTLASGSGASTTMLCWQRHFGTRAGMTQRYGLQGVWKCETHLTLKCGNKEVRFEILTHCETIEKTLQVVDCEKHFALWTGMVWTRSSQDWS